MDPSKLITAKLYTPTLLFVLGLAGFIYVALSDGTITFVEGAQFLALAAGSFVTYYSPLATARTAALYKILGAVIGAVLVVIIDLANASITGVPVLNGATIAFIVLTALQALAAATGAGARVSNTAAAAADPKLPNDVVAAADPGAFAVVASRGLVPAAIDGNDEGRGVLGG